MGYNAAFSEWLQRELNQRGWNQADLARASKLPKSTISNILNMHRSPGAQTCLAISKGLNIAPGIVFARAGLFPDLPASTAVQQEVDYKLTMLNPGQQQVVLDLINSLISRSGEMSRKAGKKP